MGQIITFSEADLFDGVAFSQSHRHHTDQIRMDFLLCVLLPPHDQCWVTAGWDQVLIE